MKNQNKFKSFIFFILVLLVWLFLVAFLTGCSTQKKIDWRLKQSNRHYEKAISLGYSPLIDTVYIPDTVITKQIKHDTAFIYKPSGDTVIITKDRLKWRYITHNDSIFIEAECEADTIIKEIPVTVQEKIYVKQNLYDILGLNSWWEIALLWLFIVIIVLLFVIRSFK